MSTKTENVKTFINQTGKENQLFLFIGSNNTNSTSNAPVSELETWKYSDFSLKIGKDNLIPVVKNVKWVQKRTYTPWSANTENYGNFYAYNDSNGYVYLCISDNRENRTDLIGKNVSNNIPSHVSGDSSYPDGFTWKALYKITPTIERFVTEQWIPVVSFDVFDDLDKSSPYAQMQSFCLPSGTKTSGNCSLYFKDNLKYLAHTGSYVNGIKGNLYQTLTMECFECYNTFKDHPQFIVDFDTATPSSTIEVKDTYDIVGDLINQNKISTSSPYYYLHQVNKNSPDEGYIVSAFIDLNGIDQENLVISKPNPELTIYSNNGTGGSIRLKTYTSAINNKIYVYGIEVVSRGSGYKDIYLELDSATLQGSLTASQLVALIDVNLDEVDGLGFDPMKVLNCKHTMVDVRIDKPTLQTSNLSIPNHINFYSLVQNPKYDSTFDTVAGTTENKYLSTLFRTTVRLSVTPPSGVGGNPILPVPDDTGVFTLSSGKVIKNVNIGTVIAPTTTGGNAKIEIKGVDYTQASDFVGSTLVVDGINYTVSSIDSQPSLIQYSGKVLSTNKTSNITIQDVDTALIRINMVKGM